MPRKQLPKPGTLPSLRWGQKFVRQTPGSDTERRIRIVSTESPYRRYSCYFPIDKKHIGKVRFNTKGIDGSTQTLPMETFASEYQAGRIEREYISIAGYSLRRGVDGFRLAKP